MSAQPRATRELCIMACVFCRDPVFIEWLQSDGMNVQHEDEAKNVILEVCNVSSRNELDTNHEAARLFHRLIRKPFLAFKNSEGQ